VDAATPEREVYLMSFIAFDIAFFACDACYKFDIACNYQYCSSSYADYLINLHLSFLPMGG
jgi:hypothetical protein